MITALFAYVIHMYGQTYQVYIGLKTVRTAKAFPLSLEHIRYYGSFLHYRPRDFVLTCSFLLIFYDFVRRLCCI